MKIKPSGVVAVLAVGGILAWSLSSGPAIVPHEVYTTEVVRGPLVRYVAGTGELKPRQQVEISSPTVAKVAHIHVREGDEVERGAPLFDLQRESLESALTGLRAAASMERTRIRRAELGVAKAQAERRRLGYLVNRGAVNGEEVELAKYQVAEEKLHLLEAKQALEKATSAVKRAEDDLQNTTVYAPISGTVLRMATGEGEVVGQPGEVAMVLADLSHVIAEVDVDETEVVSVKEGQSVEVSVDALRDVPQFGTVTEIAASGRRSPELGAGFYFLVKIVLEDPEPRLRPGMSTRARITVAEQKDTLTAPIETVVQRRSTPRPGEPEEPKDDPEEESVVFVRVGDRVEEHVVTPGIEGVLRVELLDGVEEGDELVAGPYRVLQNLTDEDHITTKAREDW